MQLSGGQKGEITWDEGQLHPSKAWMSCLSRAAGLAASLRWGKLDFLWWIPEVACGEP